MKHVYRTCDICGKVLDGKAGESRIKFKMKSYDGIDFTNDDCFDYQRWNKLDVCDNCRRKIIHYCTKEISNE